MHKYIYSNRVMYLQTIMFDFNHDDNMIYEGVITPKM